jgi:hypothetical protein
VAGGDRVRSAADRDGGVSTWFDSWSMRVIEKPSSILT